MLKLTLEQVVEGIKSLSENDKEKLYNYLPDLLDSFGSTQKAGASQSVSTQFRDVNLSGNNSAVSVQPTISSEGVNNSNFVSHGASLETQEELIKSLHEFQKLIHNSNKLPELARIGAESQIEKVINEVRKDNPDKNLIGRTISGLKQGLKGIQELAGPTASVASIVAKAWGIPAP